MSLQVTDSPGRVLIMCPSDPDFDYCSYIHLNGWVYNAWIINGACTLIGVYMVPDPNGMISTVDSYPTMILYNGSGAVVDILTYNSGLGYYEPSSEICIFNDFYVQVQGIDVTLKNGDTCSNVLFSQYYNFDEIPPIAAAIIVSTTKQTGFTFTITGGTGYVDWGDGTTSNFDASGSPASPSHTYGSSGTRTVSVFCAPGDVTAFTCSNQSLTGTPDVSRTYNMTTLNISSNSAVTAVLNNISTNTWVSYRVDICNIAGNYNLTTVQGLAGIIYLNNNSGMTGFDLPPNSNSVTDIRFNLCGIIGIADLSPLTNISGVIDGSNNSALTGVTFSTNSNVITSFRFRSCDLTGTFDISGWSGLGGNVRLDTNPNLTSVLWPTSSQTTTFFWVYNCDLTGTQDISGMTGITGPLRMDGNANMTGLTMPASSGTITSMLLDGCDLGYFDITGITFSSSGAQLFDASNNNMTAGEVNCILVDLDNTLPGSGTATLSIDGSNAAKDSTSGGCDGDTAAANIIANGYTLNVN